MGTVFDVLRRLVRWRLGGTMGRGDQFVSWIHAENFCRAIEFLIERDDPDGLVNVAAPNPLPNRELMRTLRRLCGVRIGLPATRWMLEVGAFFLRTEAELLIRNRRVVPVRLLEAGFRFQFEEGEGALSDLLGLGQRSRHSGRPIACRPIALRRVTFHAGSHVSSTVQSLTPFIFSSRSRIGSPKKPCIGRPRCGIVITTYTRPSSMRTS